MTRCEKCLSLKYENDVCGFCGDYGKLSIEQLKKLIKKLHTIKHNKVGKNHNDKMLILWQSEIEDFFISEVTLK